MSKMTTRLFDQGSSRPGLGSRSERIATFAVLGLASVFMSLSAFNLLSATWQSQQRKGRQRAHQQDCTGESSRRPRKAKEQVPRPPADSAVVNVTYVTTPEDCQAQSVASFAHTRVRPKIHAGALFKLIDVAAGVAARRHARGPCLTISVDSVILLKPIFLGDLVHVSASVNRAWTTSMEIGVRIVKETVSARGPVFEYVSHSYLTFVAFDKSAAVGGILSKPTLPAVQATTRLESRRHMLAGRRRNKRLEDSRKGVSRDGVSIEVKANVRKEVADLLRKRDRQALSKIPSSDEEAAERDKHLRMVEIEMLIQAWAMGEPGVLVEDGLVQVTQEGDEPLRFTEKEVRRRAHSLRIKLPGDEGYDVDELRKSGSATPIWLGAASQTVSPRRVALRLAEDQVGEQETKINESDLSAPSRHNETKIDKSDLQETKINKSDLSAPRVRNLAAEETLTSTMHLVFPQHTNSHGIIFGGNTMSWSEDVAIMACRNLRLHTLGGDMAAGTTWKTVAMDGLEFNVKVGVGELMIFAAIVVRTFARSCEVYVIAHAENHEGERRFTNDVLFTMACDGDAPRLLDGGVNSANAHQQQQNAKANIATAVSMPSDSALASFAAAGDARRQQRLQLRDMLVRVYGS